MRRFRLVHHADPSIAATLRAVEAAGFQVQVADGGFQAVSPRFATVADLAAHFVFPRLCLSCGDPAEQLCAACAHGDLVDTDGSDTGGEARGRHPSVSAGTPHLEVVR